MACLNLILLLSASQIEEFAFSLQSDVLISTDFHIFFIEKCALDEGFAFFLPFFLFVPD